MFFRSAFKKVLILSLLLGLFACRETRNPIEHQTNQAKDSTEYLKKLQALKEAQVLEAAGHTSQVLEYAMMGLGFLAPSAKKAKSTEQNAVLTFAVKAIRALLKKCVMGTALTTSKDSLQLKLPPKGCSIPLTGIRFQGELNAKESQNTKYSALSVIFKNFSFYKVFLDGEVHIRNNDKTLHYRILNLKAKVLGVTLQMEGKGSYQPSFDKLGTTFSGTGKVEHKGIRYEFEAKDINRSYINGCYPKSGTLRLKVGKIGSSLNLGIKIEFNNDLHGGLDSNDTGIVYVTFRGIRRKATLKKRLGCLKKD